MTRVLAVLVAMLSAAASSVDDSAAAWIGGQGGRTERDGAGNIIAADLTGSWIGDADLERLGKLARLERLVLAKTTVTDSGFERLQGLRNVIELDCHFCEFLTEDGVARMKGWARLETLNLRGTKVTSKVFEHLARMPALRRLDLAHTQISDEGFEHLARLERLESLAIGGNRLEGVALVALKQAPALQHLDVGGIQRVDSGLWGLALSETNLARLAALAQLESLDLNGANLNDRGLDRPGHAEAERAELRDLGPLGALKKLRRLDLSRTRVTPAALAVLGELPALRELRLGYAPHVDDRAVDALLAAPALEAIYLHGAPLSDAALQLFREKRPTATIRR